MGALGTRRLTPQCSPKPWRDVWCANRRLTCILWSQVIPGSSSIPWEFGCIEFGSITSTICQETQKDWCPPEHYRHTDLEPGCWLRSGQWTSSSHSQHNLRAAEGKPIRLGQAVDSEKTLYLGSSPSQLQFTCNLAGTSGDPERPCTQLQLPHSHSLPAILSIQSLSRRYSHLCNRRYWNGLILDSRSLLAIVSEQSCWHRDLAGDTPAAPHKILKNCILSSSPIIAIPTSCPDCIRTHQEIHLCFRRSWNGSMNSSRPSSHSVGLVRFAQWPSERHAHPRLQSHVCRPQTLLRNLGVQLYTLSATLQGQTCPPRDLYSDQRAALPGTSQDALIQEPNMPTVWGRLWMLKLILVPDPI